MENFEATNNNEASEQSRAGVADMLYAGAGHEDILSGIKGKLDREEDYAQIIAMCQEAISILEKDGESENLDTISAYEAHMDAATAAQEAEANKTLETN